MVRSRIQLVLPLGYVALLPVDDMIASGAESIFAVDGISLALRVKSWSFPLSHSHLQTSPQSLPRTRTTSTTTVIPSLAGTSCCASGTHLSPIRRFAPLSVCVHVCVCMCLCLCGNDSRARNSSDHTRPAQVPDLQDISGRLSFISGTAQLQELQRLDADSFEFIHPPVAEFGTLQWSKVQEVHDISTAHMREKTKGWMKAWTLEKVGGEDFPALVHLDVVL